LTQTKAKKGSNRKKAHHIALFFTNKLYGCVTQKTWVLGLGLGLDSHPNPNQNTNQNQIQKPKPNPNKQP